MSAWVKMFKNKNTVEGTWQQWDQFNYGSPDTALCDTTIFNKVISCKKVLQEIKHIKIGK